MEMTDGKCRNCRRAESHWEATNILMLGDNRNHSSDSRDATVGVLKREDLLGRAWIRIWPLDEFGVICHE